ncbi:phage major capsid protein, partial [Candidatus Poribacteria bacterium]|nr:phage major capsid protein [Candidatus Poribacteria bacterium]
MDPLEAIRGLNDVSADRCDNWITELRAGEYATPMPLPTGQVRIDGSTVAEGRDLVPVAFAAILARRLSQLSAVLRCSPRLVSIDPVAGRLEMPTLVDPGGLTGLADSAASAITVAGSAVTHFDSRRVTYDQYITGASAAVLVTAQDDAATVELVPANGQVSGLVQDGAAKTVTATITNPRTNGRTVYTINVYRRSATGAGPATSLISARMDRDPTFGKATLNAGPPRWATVPAPYELIRDAGLDGIAVVADLVARRVVRTFDRLAIATGRGSASKEPDGLLADVSNRLTTIDAAGGTPTVALLTQMLESLDPAAVNMAHPAAPMMVSDLDSDMASFDAAPPTWMMGSGATGSAAVVAALDSGRWWTPEAGWPVRIGALPVVRSGDLPVPGDGNVAVILGDWFTG